jgi:hypothetical protein
VLDETYLYSRAPFHILGDNHQKNWGAKLKANFSFEIFNSSIRFYDRHLVADYLFSRFIGIEVISIDFHFAVT